MVTTSLPTLSTAIEMPFAPLIQCNTCQRRLGSAPDFSTANFFYDSVLALFPGFGHLAKGLAGWCVVHGEMGNGERGWLGMAVANAKGMPRKGGRVSFWPSPSSRRDCCIPIHGLYRLWQQLLPELC
ncbi:GD21712 [Drosophila simulans]|uniref:GD21712 n=1 Tax=Drosophila simulans TaxID=7240 RepID=B4QAH8_DROSI|nr:GD21712 [Drosophila simulans]